MLFHWLCTKSFNEDQTLEEQRAAPSVKRNPLYWLAFIATFLSLWLGREFHILLDQVTMTATNFMESNNRSQAHLPFLFSISLILVVTGSFLFARFSTTIIRVDP